MSIFALVFGALCFIVYPLPTPACQDEFLTAEQKKTREKLTKAADELRALAEELGRESENVLKEVEALGKKDGEKPADLDAERLVEIARTAKKGIETAVKKRSLLDQGIRLLEEQFEARIEETKEHIADIEAKVREVRGKENISDEVKETLLRTYSILLEMSRAVLKSLEENLRSQGKLETQLDQLFTILEHWQELGKLYLERLKEEGLSREKTNQAASSVVKGSAHTLTEVVGAITELVEDLEFAAIVPR